MSSGVGVLLAAAVAEAAAAAAPLVAPLMVAPLTAVPFAAAADAAAEAEAAADAGCVPARPTWQGARWARYDAYRQHAAFVSTASAYFHKQCTPCRLPPSAL